MRIFSRTKSHIRQEPSVKLCTKKRDPKKTTIYNPPSWDVPLFRSPFVYQHLQEFFYSPKKTVLLEDLLYLITSDTISRINIKRLQAKPLVQIDNLSNLAYTNIAFGIQTIRSYNERCLYFLYKTIHYRNIMLVL